MDVEGLKVELEEQLKKNPHKDAPDGFRDRFDTVAEQYQAADDVVPKDVLEAQLRHIRDEAEAAAKCADTHPTVGAETAFAGGSAGDGIGDDEAAPAIGMGAPAAAAPPSAAPAPTPTPAPAPAPEPEPEPGFLQRYGVALVVVVVLLVAAFLYLR
jgi:hypothetical protein